MEGSPCGCTASVCSGVWTLVPAHLDGNAKNWLLLRKDGDEPGERRYLPMLRDRRRHAARGGRLGVRAEVGRLSRDRHGRRRRSDG